jgi:hypothetical protein
VPSRGLHRAPGLAPLPSCARIAIECSSGRAIKHAKWKGPTPASVGPLRTEKTCGHGAETTSATGTVQCRRSPFPRRNFSRSLPPLSSWLLMTRYPFSRQWLTSSKVELLALAASAVPFGLHKRTSSTLRRRTRRIPPTSGIGRPWRFGPLRSLKPIASGLRCIAFSWPATRPTRHGSPWQSRRRDKARCYCFPAISSSRSSAVGGAHDGARVWPVSSWPATHPRGCLTMSSPSCAGASVAA